MQGISLQRYAGNGTQHRVVVVWSGLVGELSPIKYQCTASLRRSGDSDRQSGLPAPASVANPSPVDPRGHVRVAQHDSPVLRSDCPERYSSRSRHQIALSRHHHSLHVLLRASVHA